MTRVQRRLTRLLVLIAAVASVVTGCATPAVAHPLSTSAVLLDVGGDVVTATIELPLDELSIARGEALTGETVLERRTLTSLRAYVQAHMSVTDARARTWSTAVSGGSVEQVDGVPALVLSATLTPDSGTVGDFVLQYDAVVDLLVSHRVFVSGRYGHTGPYTTLAMLSWQTTSVPVAAATAPQPEQGFVPAVRLGVEHIAAGSDHLLFLIMLLLPAPLVALRRRWRRPSGPRAANVRRSVLRIVHVVTAFAIGHTCTLVLGALGWVELPTRLVESGIALSVLVSAIHAVRPLVRRGEVLIAGGFGLLHGLSFASLLGSLDLERSNLVSTLLGFNLGIELTQLMVVALVMPSLILLSAHPAYSVLRSGLAVVGGLLAAGWLAVRVGVIAENPLEPVGNLLVDQPLVLILGLAVLSATLAVHGRMRMRRGSPAQRPPDQRSPKPLSATSPMPGITKSAITDPIASAATAPSSDPLASAVRPASFETPATVPRVRSRNPG